MQTRRTRRIMALPAAACAARHALLPVVCAAALLAATAGFADELRVGAAAVKITPPLGAPMAGYYHPRGVEGVLDDIYAKAAVLDDGKTEVALVVCDLISLPAEVVEESRKLIADQSGIPGEQVMISATHTHTGPALTRGSSRDDMDGSGSPPARKYTAALPALVAQAVAEAHGGRVPARAAWGREQEQRLAFNRRFWMKDGTVGWNPGKHNPNTIRPVGPIDPEVSVLLFETPARQPLCTCVNFAMHADTTGGQKISADYPGALARRLAEVKGPQMLTLFANGACGDLNHVNVQWPDRQQGPEEANRLGTILAAAVLKACMDLRPVADVTLRARRQIVELPLAPLSDDEVSRAREIVERGPKAKFLDQVQAYRALDVAARQGKPLAGEVQVFTLGKELAWVSLPGEAFVALGLSIKAASPFPQTNIVELAGGSIGYIPHRSAYAEGNYEVLSARCAAGSGEMLVAAAVRMLAELHQQAK
jgi:neutral ceramidase